MENRIKEILKKYDDYILGGDINDQIASEIAEGEKHKDESIEAQNQLNRSYENYNRWWKKYFKPELNKRQVNMENEIFDLKIKIRRLTNES